jgi:serine phosphatase RsbU (regulator of sigma subunit)
MHHRFRAIDVWREMSLPALLRFSLAAFLLFGALGLVSVLIESSIRVFGWWFVVVQAVAAGGMAGSIVLLGRRRWWFTVLLVIFWNGVLFFNGGGISFVFSQSEGMRVHLGRSIGTHERVSARPEEAMLTPGLLDAVFVQRGIIGGSIIIMMVAGYTMFASVIRGEVRRRARLETEVRIAQDIQQSLLPDLPFESPACSIYGAMVPAGEVGGDYYDVVPLPGGRIALAVADVTGHGVGAGILASMTKSALRLQLGHEPDPDSVLNHLNKVLYEVSDEKTFVTFGYALIDPAACTITFATAGHPPLFHRADASHRVTPFRTKSVALGMRADSAFGGAMTVGYRAGDLLLLYTDGLLEVMGSSGEEFSERLPQYLAEVEGPPQEIVQGLLRELRQFGGNPMAFEDDVSLLCVRFAGKGSS